MLQGLCGPVGLSAAPGIAGDRRRLLLTRRSVAGADWRWNCAHRTAVAGAAGVAGVPPVPGIAGVAGMAGVAAVAPVAAAEGSVDVDAVGGVAVGGTGRCRGRCAGVAGVPVEIPERRAWRESPPRSSGRWRRLGECRRLLRRDAGPSENVVATGHFISSCQESTGDEMRGRTVVWLRRTAEERIVAMKSVRSRRPACNS